MSTNNTLKLKINSNMKKWKLVFTSGLFFLKPISDMLYQVKFLDYFLLIYVLILFGIYCPKNIFEFKKQEYLCIGVLIINLIALFCNVSGFRTFVRVSSAIPIFYIGLNMENFFYLVHRATVKYSCLLVVIINFVLFCLGKGYKQWGSAKTFSGTYYFKTDLAFAMLFSIIIIWENRTTIADTICVAFASLMCIMSNSRISYVMLCFLVMACVYKILVKRKASLLYLVCLFMLAGCVSLLLVKIIGGSWIGVNQNFLSTFSMNETNQRFQIVDEEKSASDIVESAVNNEDESSRKLIYMYINANTQGRLKIWENCLKEWINGGLFKILFGGGYVFCKDPHSLYVGILIYNGIVGASIYFFVFVKLIKRILLPVYSETYYQNIFLMALFLCFGISNMALESTQYTWMIALVVSENLQKNMSHHNEANHAT